jgi:pimeloyl-ACP methyl ester carboxylesterase
MSRYTELTNSRIHYDDVGRGDVVLLLHGLGLDLRMWDEQVPALAERYRVVRIDLHGFGRSSPAVGAYSHSSFRRFHSRRAAWFSSIPTSPACP